MNYNLVVDTSNFKPFGIADAINILKEYRSSYDKNRELLEKLEDQLGNLVLPEDSKYKGVLDEYNDLFADVAEAFSKKMNIKTASAILNIRSKYRKEIKPIKEAADAYNKYVDKWDTIYGADTTAIRGFDYTIDDFYGGKRPDLGYRSGAKIEDDARKYFTGYNNAVIKMSDFKKIAEGQYLQRILQGMDPLTALQASLIDYDNATGGIYSDEIQNLVNHMLRVFDAQNTKGFTDEAKRLVWNRISSGLMQAITQPVYDVKENKSYESQGQKDYREAQIDKLEAETEATKILNHAYKGEVWDPKTEKWVYVGTAEATRRIKEVANPTGDDSLDSTLKAIAKALNSARVGDLCTDKNGLIYKKINNRQWLLINGENKGVLIDQENLCGNIVKIKNALDKSLAQDEEQRVKERAPWLNAQKKRFAIFDFELDRGTEGNIKKAKLSGDKLKWYSKKGEDYDSSDPTTYKNKEYIIYHNYNKNMGYRNLYFVYPQVQSNGFRITDFSSPENDAKNKYKPTDFSDEVCAAIMAEARKQIPELIPDDLAVWVDWDWFGNSEVRVTLRNLDYSDVDDYNPEYGSLSLLYKSETLTKGSDDTPNTQGSMTEAKAITQQQVADSVASQKNKK